MIVLLANACKKYVIARKYTRGCSKRTRLQQKDDVSNCMARCRIYCKLKLAKVESISLQHLTEKLHGTTRLYQTSPAQNLFIETIEGVMLFTRTLESRIPIETQLQNPFRKPQIKVT